MYLECETSMKNYYSRRTHTTRYKSKHIKNTSLFTELKIHDNSNCLAHWLRLGDKQTPPAYKCRQPHLEHCIQLQLHIYRKITLKANQQSYHPRIITSLYQLDNLCFQVLSTNDGQGTGLKSVKAVVATFKGKGSLLSQWVKLQLRSVWTICPSTTEFALPLPVFVLPLRLAYIFSISTIMQPSNKTQRNNLNTLNGHLSDESQSKSHTTATVTEELAMRQTSLVEENLQIYPNIVILKVLQGTLVH